MNFKLGFTISKEYTFANAFSFNVFVRILSITSPLKLIDKGKKSEFLFMPIGICRQNTFRYSSVRYCEHARSFTKKKNSIVCITPLNISEHFYDDG